MQRLREAEGISPSELTMRPSGWPCLRLLASWSSSSVHRVAQKGVGSAAQAGVAVVGLLRACKTLAVL